LADLVTDSSRTTPSYPARRRLIIAVVVWVLIIRTLILVAADAAKVPDVWTTAVSIALLLAIFIPMSLSAVRELNEARRRGDAPPPQVPTRRSLVAFGIFTVLFWALAVWAVSFTGEFVFPLLPILCTVWLVVRIRRYNHAGKPIGPRRAPHNE
jgi:hypothetical protein